MTLREKIKRVRIIRTEPDKIIKSKLACKNQFVGVYCGLCRYELYIFLRYK